MSNYRYIGNLEENDIYLDEDPSEAFTAEEIATLKAINIPDDITSIRINDTFEDDHAICAELEVNGVKFSALWIIPEFYADIVYAGKGVDSAKEEVIKYIKDYTKDVN